MNISGDEVTIKVTTTNTYRPGIQEGDLHVIQYNPRTGTALVYEDGHHYWHSAGTQAYEPAKIHVLVTNGQPTVTPSEATLRGTVAHTMPAKTAMTERSTAEDTTRRMLLTGAH